MIWIDNIGVLFEVDNLKYYMPSSNLTADEGANALVRFMIYLGLILFLFNGNIIYLIIFPLIMMGIQYYLYKEGKLESLMYKIFNSKMSVNQTGGGNKANEDANANNDSNYTNNLDDFSHIKDPNSMEKEWKEERDGSAFQTDCDKLWNKDFDESGKPCQPKDELGPWFNGEGRDDGKEGIRPDLPLDQGNPNDFTGKEIECKRSTIDNPFGNALPYDNVTKQILPVCPDEYKKDKNFLTNLFSNIDDVFNRNNSQRQYTSNASTTRVNDQEAFMQFCFNTPYSSES